MKKIISILLIITLIISLCGCKSENEKQEEQKPVLVEINENNFDEYFYIKADFILNRTSNARTYGLFKKQLIKKHGRTIVSPTTAMPFFNPLFLPKKSRLFLRLFRYTRFLLI